jgi:hypothetical protein
MAAATEARPPVITSDLVTRLAELLAFRHLFRGALIALTRWNKLSPLVARVDEVHQRNRSRVHKFSALSSDGFGRSQQIDWQKWNDINPGRGRPKVGKRILLPVSASWLRILCMTCPNVGASASSSVRIVAAARKASSNSEPENCLSRASPRDGLDECPNDNLALSTRIHSPAIMTSS